MTARKREESLQDIAVSVTGISTQLENAAVKSLQDINNYAPNVNFDFGPASANGAAISIRGISHQDPDKSMEAPVGVIVDGVFMGTTAGQLMDSFDLERVEVLRGPQGTLFGKNTTGGAVNVIRSKPTKEYGAKLQVGVGDFGLLETKAIVNTPLTESGGLKLSVNKKQSDGYWKNTTTGKDTGGLDSLKLGAAIAFDVSDNFDVLFTFDRIDDDSERGAFANFNADDSLTCLASVGGVEIPGVFSLPADPTNPAFGSGCMSGDAGSDEDHVSTNGPNTGTIDDDFLTLTMNWGLGDWQLTSVTGYQDRQEEYDYEWDSSPVQLLTVTGEHDYSQLSQEVRINGQLNENVNLTAGVYYFESDAYQYQDSFDMWYYFGFGPGFAIPDGMGGEIPLPLPLGDVSAYLESFVTSETTALFASMDWALTDDLSLNLGGRYTWEEKTFKGGPGGWDSLTFGQDFVPPQGPVRNLKDDWQEFSPRIALQYNISNDVMAFTSYAKGFKSGGFFARTQNVDAISSFDPEYVDTFEAGLKSEWLDNRVRLNATAFMTDYSDKQEEILVPAGDQVNTIVRNAGEVEISGLELELQAAITTDLSIYMMAGLLDAEYEKFFADVDGELFPGEGEIKTDNSYLKLRNTPDKTFGAGFDYFRNTPLGELSVNYSYRWSDEYETEFFNDPRGHVNSMGLHSLSTNLTIDESYKISLYGRNLTNERYARLVKIGTLSQMGMYNAPRTYGVQFTADF
ncbi:TonB-dependent receptor [Microbulbifer agarilyticus]|uniref:TonB-dependent receptor n=1 Tax=Microbulbifer agarilyticus TaxID=260552 RepID=UPI001C967E0E|nr:TonB-dependent receptor [Microbulbifer agarilyticus]MBY6211180.1 TonB-dependent receptor [Microbulbifer agarilyticus]